MEIWKDGKQHGIGKFKSEEGGRLRLRIKNGP